MPELTRTQRTQFDIYIEQYNRLDLNLHVMIFATYAALAGPNGTEADGQDRLFELIRLYESDPAGVLTQMRENHGPAVIGPLSLLIGLRHWIESHGPAPGV